MPVIALGSPVTVTSKRRYKGRFYMMDGFISRISYPAAAGISTQVGVSFPDIHNERSQYDCFWFSSHELCPTSKVDEYPRWNAERRKRNMYRGNNNTDILMAGYKPIRIRFLDSNKDCDCNYACYEPNIKNGDLVCVMTGHHGYALANVIDVNPSFKEVDNGMRQVITIIDTSEFEKRKETAARAAELKREMDERIKEMQKFAIYEVMAAKDPTLAALFNEFKSITGVPNDGQNLPAGTPVEEAASPDDAPDTMTDEDKRQYAGAAGFPDDNSKTLF